MTRCMRPGRITNNGYLNFLREFRKRCCGMSAVETVRAGAKQWRRLTCAQKDRYRAMGRMGSRRRRGRSRIRRKRSCGPMRRKRRRSRRRSSSCRRPRRSRKRSSSRKRCRPRKRSRSRKSCRPRRRRSSRKSCRPRRRSYGRKRRRPSRRSRCGHRRKRCQRPGPVTPNAFLNFLRAYRRKHCGLKPQELVQKAARRWCKMSPECKRRFIRQACKMSKSKRKRRSAKCRKC